MATSSGRSKEGSCNAISSISFARSSGGPGPQLSWRQTISLKLRRTWRSTASNSNWKTNQHKAKHRRNWSKNAVHCSTNSQVCETGTSLNSKRWKKPGWCCEEVSYILHSLPFCSAVLQIYPDHLDLSSTSLTTSILFRQQSALWHVLDLIDL